MSTQETKIETKANATVNVETPAKSKAQLKREQDAAKREAKANAATKTETVEEQVAAKMAAKKEYFASHTALAGKTLFAYTCAIFTEFGLIGRNKSMKIRDFTSFYNSRKAFTYHNGLGRYETLNDGKFRLSASGRAWFKAGRIDGKNVNQAVTEEMLADMLEFIRTGNKNGIARLIVEHHRIKVDA